MSIETSASSASPELLISTATAPGRIATVARVVLRSVAVVVVLLVVAWAFFPGVFAPHSPLEIDPSARYAPPSGAHPFGTDNLGRDLLSRVIHGATLSLQAAVIAVLVGFVAGVAIGLVSGSIGGRIDDVLMRIVDVGLAIPGLLLSLLVVTALGFGTLQVAVAVGVGAIASFARVMRSEVMRVRTSAFVEAAGASGVRPLGVLLRYILPNASGSVIALAGLEFGQAILSVAALGFLGFGAAPPQPEWGSLVAEGRNFLASAWWMSVLPGLVVVVVVVCANALSRAAYRRLA